MDFEITLNVYKGDPYTVEMATPDGLNLFEIRSILMHTLDMINDAINTEVENYLAAKLPLKKDAKN